MTATPATPATPAAPTTDAARALATEQYIALTTFRRDGRAVPTPLWFAIEGGKLYAYTGAASGKVKRIRNSGRVTVVACDQRGKKLKGPTYEATARLLPASEGPRVDALLRRKYGFQKRLFEFMETVARRFGKQLGGERAYIEITPA